MRKMMMAGLTALTLTLAVPHMASAQAATATADPVTPAKIALTKRYIAAMHMDQMISGMMRQMIPAMMTQMRQSHPDLTDDQMAIATDAVTGSVEDMLPKLTDRTVQIYAETFTTDELTRLDDFYESPTGQSIIAKIPVATGKLMPIMMELMPDMQADVVKRMCAKMTCPASVIGGGKPSA